mmetsp:Transcript_63338/g.125211  ORF Transcript_63338/g.125211 Transcript_63338/m.125211 type:complete len:325 (+) Transcript_63338:194-1168(+)
MKPKPSNPPLSLVELKVLVVLLRVRFVPLLEVLGHHHVAVVAHRLHACLLHDACNLSARDFLGTRDVVLEVKILGEVHPRGEHLKDETLLPPARLRELNLPIKSARSQQGGVKRVRAVGAHDHLDVDRLVEAVHLSEQLHQDALHLTISPSLRVKALCSNGVDLIDKNYSWSVLARKAEDVTHHARALAEVFLHELGAHHSDEGRRRVVRHRFGKHRFSGARRPIEQHATRRVDADLRVEFVVSEREFDRLANLLLLLVAPTDVAVAHVWLLVGTEHGNGRVCLWRQHVDHSIRVPVKRHGRARLEQLAVDGRQDAHIVVRTRR